MAAYPLMPRRAGGASISAFCLACLAALALSNSAPRPAATAVSSDKAENQPLGFIPNRGQTDPRVRYYAQTPAFSAYFTERKLVLDLHRGGRAAALELRFVGADPHPEIVADRRAAGVVNYLTAAHRYTGLPRFSEVRYRDLWPGIDLAFRSEGGKLKYEFLVGPGADPSRIRLAYAGADSLSVDRAGGLAISTPVGPLRDSRPVTYQGGKSIPTRYVAHGSGFGFALGGYDPTGPLTIDPELTYSTYLGGSNDEAGSDPNQITEIAVDSQGNAYVTGYTASTDFPTTVGAYDQTNNTGGLFLTKLNAAGSGLVYSTFLNSARGASVAVDAQGQAFVTGEAAYGLPTTPGAFDTTFNGGSGDAFVAKFDATGSSLLYSTYLGGGEPSGDIANLDEANSIAIDSSGNAYVTGVTGALDFPVTPGAYSGDLRAPGVFVTKLNATGAALVYSTLLGDARVGGIDGGYDIGNAIAVDSQGNTYVVGTTSNPQFPTTAGAYDTS